MRQVEQAVHTFLKPSLNGSGDVTFPVNWDPSDVHKSISGERPFMAITIDGKIFDFASLNEGSRVLGTSRKTIEVVLNHDTFVYCEGIDIKARFFEADRAISTESLYSNPYNAPNAVTPIDLQSLPKGKVLAYDTDFKLVATFNNFTEAAEVCGLENYYRVARYVNKRFVLVMLYGVTMILFFAQNPEIKGRTKPVVMTDVTTGIAVKYSSITECCKDLGLATANSGFINAYIKGDRLYRNIYKLCYLADYKGPVPKSSKP